VTVVGGFADERGGHQGGPKDEAALQAFFAALGTDELPGHRSETALFG
jgi:hypothetical protein